MNSNIIHRPIAEVSTVRIFRRGPSTEALDERFGQIRITVDSQQETIRLKTPFARVILTSAQAIDLARAMVAAHDALTEQKETAPYA
ncbi:MAG: hypothetical protein CVT61_00240 [Actinobacteria bacterium HGW-Actinobacteria-11]|nr:MAG: hypothetical protein CVT61_00240 [Actinobacteria bacterium HGW-Actinobacteria-11]